MKFAVPMTEKITYSNLGKTYSYALYKKHSDQTGIDGNDYPLYDKDATYNAGDYVVVDDLRRVFRCAADGTTGVFPPSDPTKWVDYGFINEYKMYSIDDQIGEKTTGYDVHLTYEVEWIDTIALLDCRFESVRIVQRVGGETIKDLSVDGFDIGCTTFADYFYKPKDYRTRLVVGVELVPSSDVLIALDGDVEIGTLVIGRLEELGCTLFGTSLRIEDRSKIADDEFTGYRKVLRYGHVRVLDGRLLIDNGDWDSAVSKISEIVGKSVLFVPSPVDRFSEMTNLAYVESAELPVDNPSKTEASISIVGVTG